MGLFKLFSKIKTQHNPNLDEIKKFFFDYHGSHMWMDRDNPSRYKQYCALDDNVKSQWHQELIDQDFELLENHQEKTWIVVGYLIELTTSSRNLVESNFQKLLTKIIEISSTLDKRERILILEHFASHAEYTSRGMDCGIYWFATKSSLEELLINTIDSLSEFLIDESDNTSKIGWENMQYRYDKAQVAIRQAIKNFL